jgi:hypothetical protein
MLDFCLPQVPKLVAGFTRIRQAYAAAIAAVSPAPLTWGNLQAYIAKAPDTMFLDKDSYTLVGCTFRASKAGRAACESGAPRTRRASPASHVAARFVCARRATYGSNPSCREQHTWRIRTCSWCAAAFMFFFQHSQRILPHEQLRILPHEQLPPAHLTHQTRALAVRAVPRCT